MTVENIPKLNNQQVDAILVEAIKQKYFTTPNDELPESEEARSKYAGEIVELCIAADKTNNKSEGVKNILFIAFSDMSPVVEQPTIAQIPVQEIPPSDNGTKTSDGLDLTTVADGVLDNLILGLDKYPQTPEVERDRQAYLAEKARRTGESPQAIQEIAPGTAQAAAIEKSPAGPESAGEGTGETADASAFARAQTPETQGKDTAKRAAKEPSELIAEVTMPMLKAHNVNIAKLASLTKEELEFIIANPEGKSKMPVDEQEVEQSAIHSDVKGTKSVGGIVPTEAPEVVVSKADLGIEVDDPSSGAISAEREMLEGMLKGTTLKAYGRGRKEVPSIGINELKFMIENPDGKVSPEELSVARIKDNAPPSPIPAQTALEVAHKPIQVEEQPDRTTIEAAQESIGMTPSVQKLVEEEAANVLAEAPIVSTPAQISPKEVTVNQPQNRAMEIIAKEHFPIPPDLESTPPVLPFDVSKCSRDELFSLHARFHAAESRMNWVLCQYEDELGDIEKLRTHREAIVANSVPFMGEDQKRNTGEYRESVVAADPEVLEFGMKEHEINKLVKRFKVLKRNYEKDCERLSRQMSKYERERLDAPR